MKFLEKSFTIPLGSAKFREGYDQIDWSRKGQKSKDKPVLHDSRIFFGALFGEKKTREGA